MASEERKYDVIVFGASGVTGQYVVEELANYIKDIKWSIAGRDKNKLKSVLIDVGKYIDKQLDDIDIIVADVNDDSSMEEMCKNTKIVINCVGPYRFSGEKVIQHCIKNKTHHVDVSGEPQFLESVQLKYFEEAKKQNIYIVGACGFDSIPCDVGLEFLRKKFGGEVNSVETYMKAQRPPGSTVNFGTWQSAIYGLAHADDLKPLRKQLREKLFTKSLPKPDYRLKRRGMLFNSDVAQGWCIPFIGSDRSVVLRTQMYNYQFRNERPIQIQAYMKTYSLLYALATLLMGAIFMLMTKFAMGRYLLEKFPEIFSLGVFSRTPPTREQSEGGYFKLIFKAKGWTEKLLDSSDKHMEPPNKTVKAVLTGPDPGYITTAICIVSSALMILQEKEKLPESGGVFTPGAAFSNTSIMEKLDARGIKMSIEE